MSDRLASDLREMLRHLPPSGSTLRLVVIGAHLERPITQIKVLRPDVHSQPVTRSTVRSMAESSVDALLAYGIYSGARDIARAEFLSDCLRVLRPGGRLILLDPARLFMFMRHLTPESMAHAIDAAGFARVLGERIDHDRRILSRGEKPYPALTMPIAAVDTPLATIVPLSESQRAALRSPFIFLLIRQSPNVPIWALPPGTLIRWEAATITNKAQPAVPIALAFTALPKAVAFMQPAVTANGLIGVTRIAKFPKAVASAWTFPLVIDPAYDALHADVAYRIGDWLPIDPQDAVTGDE